MIRIFRCCDRKVLFFTFSFFLLFFICNTLLEYKMVSVVRRPKMLLEGIGEMGLPYYIHENVSQDVRQLIEEGWARHGFNEYISDLISVHRSLPDFRDEWCKARGRFLPVDRLPTTSIIICFHDEAWSTLLRTVHSVLERSPPALVKEIILVDDFSQLPHCQLQLQEYMAQHAKVRIVRTTKRQGLIRARLVGVRHAKAPVLTFLDAHCEVTAGWLEPLLDRIARNPRTVVCPTVDIIDRETLEYKGRSLNDIKLGGFDWDLDFIWIPIQPIQKLRLHPAAPLYSPTLFGGVFSIHKKIFELLGTYDPEFEIWGCEQLELSFKIWMCGGTVQLLPCSHVGHIFSDSRSKELRPSPEVLKRSKVRLANDWMDNYAKIYFRHNSLWDFGNITSRIQLRRKLGCASFQWYVHNIYPEVVNMSDFSDWGIISNKWLALCIHSEMKAYTRARLFSCGNWQHRRSSHLWLLTVLGEIRRGMLCLGSIGKYVLVIRCNENKSRHLWHYNDKTGLIRFLGTNKCLSISKDATYLQLYDCYKYNWNQQWIFIKWDTQRWKEENR